MSHLPKRAEWYWAELIQEITVEGDERNVVHKNLVLIHADSPAQAYESAIELGVRQNSHDPNSAGALVQSRFRGLGGLDVIHDDFEHGAEILYQEVISVPEEQITQWIRSKEDLPLFQPEGCTLPNHPDYSSKGIVDEVKRRLS
jgi:hypothetical protein